MVRRFLPTKPWELDPSGVQGSLSTERWVGFDGGDLIEELSLAAVMGLFGDGGIAKQSGHLAKLYRQRKKNTVAIHSIDHQGIVSFSRRG